MTARGKQGVQLVTVTLTDLLYGSQFNQAYNSEQLHCHARGDNTRTQSNEQTLETRTLNRPLALRTCTAGLSRLAIDNTTCRTTLRDRAHSCGRGRWLQKLSRQRQCLERRA